MVSKSFSSALNGCEAVFRQMSPEHRSFLQQKLSRLMSIDLVLCRFVGFAVNKQTKYKATQYAFHII